MKKKKLILIIITVLTISLFTNQSYCQENGLNSINENDLEAHLTFIASDLLKGRKLGDPGLLIAEQYILSNLKRMNLKSPESINGYLQNIEFLKTSTDKDNSFIEVTNIKSKSQKKEYDILNIFPQPENFSYSDDIVFAGYGVTDTINGYNDYESIDVKDKAVLIMSRTYHDVEKNNSENTEPLDYELWDKVNYANKNGAKLVLWVIDPKNQYKCFKEILDFNEYTNDLYLKEKPRIRFPMALVIISQSFANQILKSSGHSLSDLQKEIHKQKIPVSFCVEKSKINVQLNSISEVFISSNIISYVEGVDSVLKNEYVVYMAHYDTYGENQKDEIFNGADDNGSGTAALLEIAEAYSLSNEKPKRSIVFLWTTAEDQGLMGSQYYVSHPVFPLNKTITCINLDMIGRVKTSEKKIRRWHDVMHQDSLFVINNQNSPILIDIHEPYSKQMNLHFDFSPDFRLEAADQLYFHQKDIPVLFYHTGFHADYHKPSDTIDKIDFGKLKRVAQLAFMVGFDIANQLNTE